MGAKDLDLGVVDHLLTTTRAVRRRLDLDRPVEPEVVTNCLRLATYTPNAANTQRWRWLVVTDPGKRARLAELYCDTARANTPPSAEQVRREFGAQMARIIDSGIHLADRLQDVPVHVIPCVRRSPSESDIFEVATMFGSILPAVWSFQLALRARGWAPCSPPCICRTNTRPPRCSASPAASSRSG